MQNFLFAVEAILGIVIIVSILMQPSKADALSGLVQGSKNDTFFSKNKARTKEVMISRVTMIAMALFAINTVVLNFL